MTEKVQPDSDLAAELIGAVNELQGTMFDLTEVIGQLRDEIAALNEHYSRDENTP